MNYQRWHNSYRDINAYNSGLAWPADAQLLKTFSTLCNHGTEQGTIQNNQNSHLAM